MRSAQVDQRFHASRVAPGSRAMKSCQSVFVRSTRGRRSSGSEFFFQLLLKICDGPIHVERLKLITTTSHLYLARANMASTLPALAAHKIGCRPSSSFAFTSAPNSRSVCRTFRPTFLGTASSAVAAAPQHWAA